MDLNEYQKETRKTREYPAIMGLMYTALGLTGEAGEYANKVKKTIRDVQNPPTRGELAGELGDVLWYVASAADEIGFNLEDIASFNLDKLRERQSKGTIKGSGDNR